jgi:hypothetical protein
MPKVCVNVHLSETVQKMDMPDVLKLGLKPLLLLSYLEKDLSNEFKPLSVTKMNSELPFTSRVIRECFARLLLEQYIEVMTVPGFTNQYRRGPALTKFYSKA